MSKYIGVKLVEAEPMIKEMFDAIKANSDNMDARQETEGYKVTYADGYVSWSPKDVFEKAYLKVDDNKELPSGISIGPDMVKNFMKEREIYTLGDKTTVVRLTLVNGFEIVESSSCVDAANYSEEMGTEICMKKIEDKIWMLLGFLLQTAVGGVSRGDDNGQV